MPLFHRKEQRAILPVSLFGPVLAAEQAPSAAPSEVVEEASQHHAGHSSGWHPEDAPSLTPGALHLPPVASQAPVQTPQTTLRLPAERDVPMHGDDAPTCETVMRSSARRLGPPVSAPSTLVALSHPSPLVYTLGYSQPGARLVLDTLIWHEGWLLMDIRHAPVSTWADWTQRALVQRYGSGYVHVPTLGNRNYRDHRLPIVLADAPAGIRDVVQAVSNGRRCVLLCACKDYRTCHRDIVGRLLQQTGVSVTHLVNHTLPTTQVRIARTGGSSGVTLSLLLTGDQLQTAATQSLLTLTRTHTITVPVAGQMHSLSVQVSLTAWPATRSHAPQPHPHRVPPYPKGDPSR